MRRVNHLSRRSFSKGGSTINYQSTAWGVLELFGNDGSDLSSVTQGNLSSSQIAFCGANDVGSSSDAIGVPDLSGQIQRCTRKAPRHLGRCTRGRATPSGWSSRTASEPVRRISTAHSRRKHLEAKSSRGDFATGAKPMTNRERDCSSLILARPFVRRRCQSCPFPSSLS